MTDIFICCLDGLKGGPEAIEAVFPMRTVQTCIVHLIRASLRYVPRRQFDAVAKDLKPIYTAINPDQAMLALEAFEAKWGQQLPIVSRMWREAWQHVIPFMAFEPEVRRVIYTTDESFKSWPGSSCCGRGRLLASRRPSGGMRFRPVGRSRSLVRGFL